MEYCEFILNQSNECKNVFFNMNGTYDDKISKKDFLDFTGKLSSQLTIYDMDQVLILYVSYCINYLEDYSIIHSDVISVEFNTILAKVKTNIQKLKLDDLEKSYDLIFEMIYNVSILLTNSLTNKMNINISKINLEMIFNKFNAIKTKSLKKRKLIKNAKIAKMKVVAKESGRLVIDLTKVLLPLAGSLMIGEKITTSYLEKKEMKPFHKYFRISITEELEYIKCILIVSFSRMEELKEGLY